MSCPVCLSAETEPQGFAGRDLHFETTARKFSFRACRNCHCLYMDPFPKHDEMVSFYPEQYWWQRSSGLLQRMEDIYRRIVLYDHLAFVARTVPATVDCRSVRLLDVGCGGGTLLGALKKRGFQVLGFDSSRHAARIAKTHSSVEVVVGSELKEAAFEDNAFDLVTLFHVLEHVSDPRAVLFEVRRILQPTGRIVLQVPNIESWQFRVFGLRWCGLDVPRHVINYSSQSVRRLLSDSGFRVRRMRHFNLRDNAPAIASSLFPFLDPVSRRVRQHHRGVTESLPLAWIKHLLYAATLAAAYPIAIAESASGTGGTIMFEAEKA
jgi:2-polyprenyl-3-methyl-5-hydroxy-6-metoxy-1,4-benzoquinol methylase